MTFWIHPYLSKAIQIINCGVKEFGHPDPLYTKPKAHAEEEEMPEDKRIKPKLPSSIAEDNPVLGQPRLWRGRAAFH